MYGRIKGLRIGGSDRDRAVAEFRAALSSLGVVVHPNSNLEHLLQQTRVYRDMVREVAARPGLVEEQRLAMESGSMMELIVRFLAHCKDPRVRAFLPHLHYLSVGSPASGAVSLSTPIAPIASEKSIHANNLLFELYYALCCLDAADCVELQDPSGDDQSNPDVIATSNGRRWGFACKTMGAGDSSTSIKLGRLWKLVKQGVAQVERSRSDIGLVVVNLKNKFDPTQWLPAPEEAGSLPNVRSFPSGEAAADSVGSWLQQLGGALVRNVGKKELWRVFGGKKALLGVRLLAKVVVLTSDYRQVRPAALDVVCDVPLNVCSPIIELPNPFENPEYGFLHQIGHLRLPPGYTDYTSKLSQGGAP